MAHSILDSCDPTQKITVTKGTMLLEESSWSGTLYVLAEGSVVVLRENIIVASISDPGAVLGEMSMLLGTAHTASVRANSKCVVYAIDNAEAYMRAHPEFAIEIARHLAKRLHNATSYIVDLNETTRAAGHIWAW